MSARKAPARKPTAMDVLATLDAVVKPYQTCDAQFGKEIDGTCFIATSEFHGTGKTFAEALVDWSKGYMDGHVVEPQVTGEDVAKYLDRLVGPLRFVRERGTCSISTQEAGGTGGTFLAALKDWQNARKILENTMVCGCCGKPIPRMMTDAELEEALEQITRDVASASGIPEQRLRSPAKPARRPSKKARKRR